MSEPAAEAGAQPLAGEAVASVAVVGATGYTGGLAAELVWGHPRLELVAATSSSHAGERLDELRPEHPVPIELGEFDPGAADLAIVALPHTAAAAAVAELRRRGVAVVDLSADFRLRDVATYERTYAPHPAPELIAGAVYGLSELNRDAIREAGLVANPGCYPTAALLALAPLAAAGLCAEVVIDAKSGTSGAGRGGVDPAEIAENLKPYAVDGHRHSPEIEQELALLGALGPTSFVPHLLPIHVGLLASCYVTPPREVGADELRELYAARYGDEPFVSVLSEPPAVRDAAGTNDALVHAGIDDRSGRVLAFCAIDNLWKGASGQAVQNLNLMLGLGETEGLR